MKQALKRLRKKFRKSFFVRTYRRLKFGFGYFKAGLWHLIHWSTKRTERTNFYYPLLEKNYRELTASLGLVFRESPEIFEGFVNEILFDQSVKSHLARWKIDRPDLRDSTLDFGRRVVWYAVARHLKPQLIVETGVHHGLGAVVLCSALLKNKAEGFPGNYIGTDIDPSAGSLLSDPFDSVGKILYGDSLDSLEKIEDTIDLFVNDSDHSADYELREYCAIERKLSKSAVVLGDNSHDSDSLRAWSANNNRAFVYLREQPSRHWYPGAGVGVSVRLLSKSKPQTNSV